MASSFVIILTILFFLAFVAQLNAETMSSVFHEEGEHMQHMFSKTNDCNEAVCASVVSYCLLASYCKCDNPRTNRTCNQQCMICLGYLAQDCCLCLDMCERSQQTDPAGISNSNVEYISEPQSELFDLLTEAPDPMERWISEVYEPNGTADESKQNGGNCTVAYMSQCMSLNKCKSSCTSMGASSYRWFHDGCCQCVGHLCPPFGLDVSKCLQCPLIASPDLFEHDGNADEDSENVHANQQESDNRVSQAEESKH